MTRRTFLAATSAVSAQSRPKAQIAITMDLEMSRNFPTWETTHWDYEKGNLDATSKRYAREAARRVALRGGKIHFFCVGRVLEQEDIGWLEEIVGAGHPVGNHTYDHVYVMANKPDDIQFRFKRAPWLLRGQAPAQAIAENVRMCTEAMKTRLKIAPNGFRTPGGFADGIAGRADVQRLLMDQGFRWISGKYPRHPTDIENPAQYLPAALKAAQPYKYSETGLLEIPMAPVSDINAFRTGRWPLDRFIAAVSYGVQWAIDNRAVYDLLIHPSCIGVVDPQMKTIDAVCSLVEKAKGQAELVGLDRVADRFLA